MYPVRAPPTIYKSTTFDNNYEQTPNTFGRKYLEQMKLFAWK